MTRGIVKIQHCNKRTSNPVWVPIKETNISVQHDVWCYVKPNLIHYNRLGLLNFVKYTLFTAMKSRSANASHMASLWWQVVVTVDVTTCIFLKKGKKKERRLCSSLFDWKYRSSLSSAWFRVLLTGSSVHFHVIQRRNDLPVFMLHSANPRGGIPAPTYHISTHLHTTNKDQRVSKVDHRGSPSQLIKQHFLH